MRVLFDTCVAIDILGKTRFIAEAFTAYDLALFKKMDVCLSVSSTTDIVYLLHSRGFLSKAGSRDVATRFMRLFTLLDNTASDCQQAAASAMTDYEDALIAHTAARHGIDFIITRNVKDFAVSPVPAFSPKKFVELYRPSCIGYEEVSWETST